MRRSTASLDAVSSDTAWNAIEREYNAMLRRARDASARFVVTDIPENRQPDGSADHRAGASDRGIRGIHHGGPSKASLT